jgi:CRP-like cAMP-binding protein
MKRPILSIQPVTADSMQPNTMLQALAAATAALVIKYGELVYLPLRRQIYESEEPITDVYFPLDSVLSIVARMRDGSQIEVGTIGREGMSAFPLLMGASATANVCYCQVKGSAIKIPAELFREIAATDPAFRQHLDRYLQAYVNMLGQLAACNRLHTVYERCARWLLMTRDRVDGDELPLTQEFLAMMLGTGRSGVTIAASTLAQAGFIKNAHGTITIRDRAGLEQAACECYEVAREQFAGLLRPMQAVPPARGTPARLKPARNSKETLDL